MTEKQPTIRQIEVGVGIVLSADSPPLVLVCQRLAGTRWEFYWEFPGGKFEPGEAADACVVRELREELGIEVEVIAALPTFTYPYPDCEIRFHPLICRLIAAEPTAIEVECFRWREIASLSTLKMLPANEVILSALGEYLQDA